MPVRYLIALTLFIFSPGAALGAAGTVNPHWSGEHCVECHVEEKPLEKGAQLKYAGDPVALCNRCHNGESAAAEIHPYGVPLPVDFQQALPPEWPRVEKKITCLTCHDALIQMTANPPRQLVNPQFVRQPYAGSRSDFCFTCHRRGDYQKSNPHQQIDEAGTIREESCLWCHQSLPDREQTQSPSELSLKGKPGKLCISCHGGKEHNHPTSGNHLVRIPEEMRGALNRQTTGGGVYLPLADNTITCTTCHNPHQSGVIQTERAARGSGEPYFLRVSRGRKLCSSCHTDVKIPARRGLREGISPARPEGTIQHKPFAEEKCKACHAVNGYTAYKQDTIFSCFQKGCHEEKMLTNTFVHEATVLGSCTFCHNPHSSAYENRLLSTEESLCAACHPLLRDSDGQFLKADHEQLVADTLTRAIPADYECSFCHNPDHKEDFTVISTELCSDCHLYLRKSISQNVHQKSSDQSCSACHEPHTSAYPYQLKAPRETYPW